MLKFGKLVNIFRGNDGRLIAILLLLSALTHFSFLGSPREVVFDEVHFGKFVTSYCCTHERIFDIHPPHAKLAIAGMAYLFGFRGGLSFESIGQAYGNISPIPLRLFPAIWGTLFGAIIFGLMRQLGASRAAAFFGGLLIIFDTAITTQTRLMLLDGMLLVATFGSLSAYLASEKKLGLEFDILGRKNGNKETDKYRLGSAWPEFNFLGGLGKWLSNINVTKHTEGWIIWSIVAGILAGFAVGTKFTGLAAVGLIGAIILWRLFKSWRISEVRRIVFGLILFLLAGIIVYGAGWALHFGLLNKSGSGDAWGTPTWEGNIIVDYWQETIDLHKTMFDANYNLSAGHPDASRWNTWPIMETSVFYWVATNVSSGESEKSGAIYFLGNPLVWWGGGMVFVLALFFSGLGIARKIGFDSLQIIKLFFGGIVARKLSDWLKKISRKSGRSSERVNKIVLWIPLLGYIISFGPLVRVPRSLFLYHYLTPLIFSLLFGLLWLDKYGWFSDNSIDSQPRRFFISIGILLALFVFFSPITYGFIIDSSLYSRIFWFESWS